MVYERLFDVEAIIGERKNDNGDREFLVKWEGYPDSESTWEPREHLPTSFLFQWLEEKMRLKELEAEMVLDDDAVSEADGRDL